MAVSRPPSYLLVFLIGLLAFSCIAGLYLFEALYIPKLRQLERHEKSIYILSEIFGQISNGARHNSGLLIASDSDKAMIRNMVMELLVKDEGIRMASYKSEEVEKLEQRLDGLMKELKRIQNLVDNRKHYVIDKPTTKLTAVTKSNELTKAHVEPTSVKASSKPWRDDFQCGVGWPSDDGSQQKAECNPDGQFPCCSASGWCGISRLHCECAGCIDYRQIHSTEVTVPATRDKRIAIVIPYRDRESHYQKFERHLADFVRELNVENKRNQEFHVFLIEQFDNQLFNRGWLFNVGFREVMRSMGDGPPDCIVMQDVDNLPMSGVDFGSCTTPTQLSSEIECWGWSVPYPGNILRPPKGHGKFLCLHDSDHTPRRRPADDKPMWERLQRVRSGDMIWRSDGINNVEYVLRNEFVKSNDSIIFAGRQLQDTSVNSTARGFTLHWKSVASKKTAVETTEERIYLIVRRELCGSQTDLRIGIKKVPSDLDELRELLPEQCKRREDIRFLAIDFNRQLGTVIDHQWRLQRFIRTLPSLHKGSIHALSRDVLAQALEKGKCKNRRYIRDFPACIGQANDASGSGMKHRINVGTDWCGDQGWTHLLGFKVLHLDDVKYVPSEDLTAICISVSPQGWVYRFIEIKEATRVQCPSGYDERSRKTWNDEKIMYVRKSSRGEPICVGFLSSGGHSRWMAAAVGRSGSCDQEGYVHEFTFNSVTETYIPPLQELCIKSVGDRFRAPPRDENCPEENSLRVLRNSVDPEIVSAAVPLCLDDSGNLILQRIQDCKGHTTLFALEESKYGQATAWCLTDSSLKQGSCGTANGSSVVSIELEDVDENIVTFIDDAIL
ncbi:hypothetical protein FOL47_006032 [Perkinsus chesapeaki]|uniref:Galactosyltransferase N-terminal domain-containing protein n=1 Tax=Perkinsus chesapeaki TaxID=330153 RepID=A0A7J6LUM7_PERCH|nr:hypothetical protein FOL47_006032 [Perkinsus chesapeaki]